MGPRGCGDRSAGHDLPASAPDGDSEDQPSILRAPWGDWRPYYEEQDVMRAGGSRGAGPRAPWSPREHGWSSRLGQERPPARFLEFLCERPWIPTESSSIKTCDQ